MDGIKEAFSSITHSAPSPESTVAAYSIALLRKLRHAAMPTSFSSIHDRWSCGATQKSTERALQLLVEEGEIERIEDVGTRPKYRAYTEADRADRMAAAKAAPTATMPEQPAPKRTRVRSTAGQFAADCEAIMQAVMSKPMTTMELCAALGFDSGKVSRLTAQLVFQGRLSRNGGKGSTWQAATVTEPKSAIGESVPISGITLPNAQAIREHRCELILSVLRKNGPMRAYEITAATGISTPWTSVLTHMLGSQGFIKREGGAASHGAWSIVPQVGQQAEAAPAETMPVDELDTELAAVIQSLSAPRIVIAPIENLDAKVKVVQQLSASMKGAVGKVLREIGADLNRIASAVPAP
ncbi:hypothetical protein [Nevskia ramosa]|uniref:hypothetical protein n=1 Tax=Nevskia ramosa TaxID=64002 RepID=UPI003D13E2D4